MRNWKTLGGPDAPIEVLAWRKPALIALFVEWMVLGGQSVTHQRQAGGRRQRHAGQCRR
ncbi:MAG: hypothetical protein U1E47_05590 [Rivihabitans pingtungensis]